MHKKTALFINVGYVSIISKELNCEKSKQLSIDNKDNSLEIWLKSLQLI